MFSCKKCLTTFTSKQRLEYHEKHKVCEKPVLPRTCPKCGLTFRTKQWLDYHILHRVCETRKLLQGSDPCPVCFRRFEDASHLRRHKCQKECPIGACVCSENGTDNLNLTSPPRCGLCGRQFEQEGHVACKAAWYHDSHEVCTKCLDIAPAMRDGVATAIRNAAQRADCRLMIHYVLTLEPFYHHYGAGDSAVKAARRVDGRCMEFIRAVVAEWMADPAEEEFSKLCEIMGKHKFEQSLPFRIAAMWRREYRAWRSGDLREWLARLMRMDDAAFRACQPMQDLLQSTPSLTARIPAIARVPKRPPDDYYARFAGEYRNTTTTTTMISEL